MTTNTVAGQENLTSQIAPVGAWDRFSFATLRFLVGTLARCLTLPGLYRFGQGFGFLEWVVNHKRRRRFASPSGPPPPPDPG